MMYNTFFTDKPVGMQLVNWDSDANILTVKKDDEVYNLVFDDSDEGDCCGYNDFFAELYVSKEDLGRNPIITNIRYEHNDSGLDDCDKCFITFLGESKKLISISSESGSGSGYCYGAAVSVKCKALDIDECVTEW